MNVSALGSNYAAPLWKGTKSIAQDFAHFTVGVDRGEQFGTLFRDSVKKDGLNNFWGNFGTAWKDSKKVVENKSLWQTVKGSFSSIIPEVKALKGLPTFAKNGKIMNSFKIFGKRMPLIGNLLTFAFAAPSIYSAFTDTEHGGGLFAGVKEIGKTCVGALGMAVGFMVGEAICPIAGGIGGAMLGSWLSEKITGKPFNEEKEEAMAKVKEPEAQGLGAEAQQATPSFGMSPEEQQKYEQIKAAHDNYSSNPFG